MSKDNYLYGDQVFLGKGDGIVNFKSPNGVINIEDLSTTDPILGLVKTQIVIRELADFPTPVAGIIILEANTSYFIQGDVDIGPNTLDFCDDNISIMGVEKRITSLICNNSGNLFQTTHPTSISVKNITLRQEGSGDIGEIIVSTISRFVLSDVVLESQGGALIGNTGGVLQIVNSSFQATAYIHRNNGMNILDFSTTSFSDSGGSGVPAALIDFETGTQTSILTIFNCFLITFANAIALRAVTPDLLLNSTVVNTTFTGTGTLYSGMSQASNSWIMSDNFNMISSHSGGSIGVVAPTGTVGLTLNVWEDITPGANWAVNEGFEKFVLTDVLNGEITYNGTRSIDYLFGGYLSVERSSPGLINVQLGVSVNGTVVESSVMTIGIDTNTLHSMVLPLSSTVLDEGDIIKMVVRNITDSNDVDVSYGGFGIH